MIRIVSFVIRSTRNMDCRGCTTLAADKMWTVWHSDGVSFKKKLAGSSVCLLCIWIVKIVQYMQQSKPACILIEILIYFFFFRMCSLSCEVKNKLSVSDCDITDLPEFWREIILPALHSWWHDMECQFSTPALVQNTQSSSFTEELQSTMLVAIFVKQDVLVWVIILIHNHVEWKLDSSVNSSAVWMCLGGLQYVALVLCVFTQK